jgi:tRNA U38,U39,U40 pseudouridine synthase TruA
MKQYKVRRANGSTFKATFTTYEQARSFARSQIRKLVAVGKLAKVGMWDGISRNPTCLAHYGFKIVSV